MIPLEIASDVFIYHRRFLVSFSSSLPKERANGLAQTQRLRLMPRVRTSALRGNLPAAAKPLSPGAGVSRWDGPEHNQEYHEHFRIVLLFSLSPEL